MGQLRFGKYAGYDLRDIPTEYLEWMITQSERTIRDFSAELERRQTFEDASLSMAERIVQAGYRALAKQYHPDFGGTNVQMQELNGTIEALREMLRRLKDAS